MNDARILKGNWNCRFSLLIACGLAAFACPMRSGDAAQSKAAVAINVLENAGLESTDASSTDASSTDAASTDAASTGAPPAGWSSF